MELWRILSDREMRDCLLLVFANKQDLAGALSPAEVTDRLHLRDLQNRVWFVHPSCATSGEVCRTRAGRQWLTWQGLFEGLGWLSQNLAPSSGC